MKQLIINADDFCASTYINQGTIKAIEANAINSVSAMMNISPQNSNFELDYSANQLIELKKRYPNLNIGVHLTITSGKPSLSAEKVSSLLKKDGSGEFMDINQYNYDQVDLIELYQELKNQILLLKNTGIELDHLSSHHGTLTIFNDFFKIYMSLAIEFNVPIRNPILISTQGIKGFRRSGMKNEAVTKALDLMEEVDARKMINIFFDTRPASARKKMTVYNGGKLRYADFFIDTFYKNGTKNRLKTIFRNLQENKVAELLVHLGHGNENCFTPNGIEPEYYRGRRKELITLLRFKPDQEIKRSNSITWMNFQSLKKK